MFVVGGKQRWPYVSGSNLGGFETKANSRRRSPTSMIRTGYAEWADKLS